MIMVSNSDIAKAIRLLTSFSSYACRTRKEEEERRQSKLLIRKWKKKQSGPER